MSWGAIAGAAASAVIGGAMSAKGQKDAAKAAASGKGPWGPTAGAIQGIIGKGDDWLKDAEKTGFINPDGTVNEDYFTYLQSLQNMQPEIQQQVQGLIGTGQQQLAGAGQSAANAQDIYNQLMSGQLALTPEQITEQAGKFVDNDLLNAQIEAATRGDVRNLTEGVLPTIDRNATATGNLGSSRTGVQAAIAERATNERIADTSANMRSQAYNDALTRAQGIEQGNIGQLTTGASGSMNVSNNLSNLSQQNFNTAQNMTDIMMSQYKPLLQSAELQKQLSSWQNQDKIGERDYMLNLLKQYAGLVQPFTGFENAAGVPSTGSMLSQSAGNAIMQGSLAYMGTKFQQEGK